MKTYTKNDAVATDGAQLGKDTRSCFAYRERERERDGRAAHAGDVPQLTSQLTTLAPIGKSS